MTSWFFKVLGPISDVIFISPMHALFMNGPAILGCWSGRAIEDICSQLTNTPSSIWVDNMDKCQNIVDTNFRTFMVTLESGLYIYSLYKCTSMFFQIVWGKCCRSTKSKSPRMVLELHQPLPPITDRRRSC